MLGCGLNSETKGTCSMKLLVIDSGGRGHSVVWKVAQFSAEEIWCAPGNAGIGQERMQNGMTVQCVPLEITDLAGLLQFALEKRPDLTLVGADDPWHSVLLICFRVADCASGVRTDGRRVLKHPKRMRSGFARSTACPAPRASPREARKTYSLMPNSEGGSVS